LLGSTRKGARAFTDAITGGPGAFPVASAPARADTSMGSPNGVPVPCTARAATLLGSQPLVTSALATSACTKSRFSAPRRCSDCTMLRELYLTALGMPGGTYADSTDVYHAVPGAGKGPRQASPAARARWGR